MKLVGLQKNESDYNYHNEIAFYRFNRDFRKFLKRSLGFKYNGISEFYKFLGEFETGKVITIATMERENGVMNNVVKLYGIYFDSYEDTYDEKNVNEKEGPEPQQFKISV